MDTTALALTHARQTVAALTTSLREPLRGSRLSTMNTASVHRAVRVTGRTSAVLFAAAQFSQALRLPSVGAWRPLYLGFVATHAVHFTAVTRYAAMTNGRNLFPGGRDMNDVGGWPTVLGIYALFFALASTAWAGPGRAGRVRPGVRRAGSAATGLLGAMFASFYLGQVPRSRWNALPATIIGAAVLTNIAAAHQRPPACSS